MSLKLKNKIKKERKSRISHHSWGKLDPFGRRHLGDLRRDRQKLLIVAIYNRNIRTRRRQRYRKRWKKNPVRRIILDGWWYLGGRSSSLRVTIEKVLDPELRCLGIECRFFQRLRRGGRRRGIRSPLPRRHQRLLGFWLEGRVKEKERGMRKGARFSRSIGRIERIYSYLQDYYCKYPTNLFVIN